MIQIIDNFLPEEEFKSIQSIMMSDEFFWYYVLGCATTGKGEDGYHMTHTFFEPPQGPNSPHCDMWKPMMKRIKISEVMRIKANMILKTPEPFYSHYHSDNIGEKTGLLYINTNNGYTEFENGVIVNSVANRYLSFDTYSIHRGVTCTDEMRRVVVNFNYS